MSDEERKKVYRSLFLANFLIALGFGVVDPFFPVYAISAGATGLHIALIYSGYSVAKTVVLPLTGWWSDRRGRRGLILAGLCIFLAVSLAYLSMPGPLALIALRILQGVGAALVRPISLAFVGDIAPVRKEAETMGTFDISFYGAAAIGPVIGGLIKDEAGFFGLFASLSGLCFLALLMALFFVTASPNHGSKNMESTGMNFTGIRNSKMLLGLSGFIFTRSFGITLFVVFLPIFMHQNLKLTGLEMGIVMGAATVVIAVLLRPMGYLSDKLKRSWLVAAGGGMAALLTFCLPMAQGFSDLLFLSIGIGVFSAASIPASSALLVGEGNLYGMGLTMGIFNTAMNLAAVLAPLAGGLALGFFGIDKLFYGVGTFGVIGVMFFVFCAWLGVAPDGK